LPWQIGSRYRSRTQLHSIFQIKYFRKEIEMAREEEEWFEELPNPDCWQMHG